MRCFLIVVFVCCLAVPARLSAQTAAECVVHGDTLRNHYEFDKAIAAYTQALAVANPNDPKEKETIFLAYRDRGDTWNIEGEHDKAIADFNRALAIHPKDALTYSIRGGAWASKGEHDKAIADYSKSLEIDMSDGESYIERGDEWYYAKGEFGKAIADYAKAAEINPGNVLAYYRLGEIYATCPDAKYRDGKKAVENATKAYELDVGDEAGDCGMLDAIAAAYAESGDFAKAREFQEKAIDSASDSYLPDYRSRLELYKQGKPFHRQPVKK